MRAKPCWVHAARADQLAAWAAGFVTRTRCRRLWPLAGMRGGSFMRRRVDMTMVNWKRRKRGSWRCSASSREIRWSGPSVERVGARTLSGDISTCWSFWHIRL